MFHLRRGVNQNLTINNDIRFVLRIININSNIT